MGWIKWTILATVGFAPAMAFADDADQTAKPEPDSVQIKVTPLKSDAVEPKAGKYDKAEVRRDVVVKDYVLVRDDADDHQAKPPFDQREGMKLAQSALKKMLSGLTHEKGSYLGVSATPPPMVLRKQLGIAPGMGLVVDFVVPDSPAGKAGLQKYDVLQKIDDQLIVNPPQFSVLVRSHKPGDEIKLSVIRDGKPQTLSAKLIEHDVEPLPGEEDEDGNALQLHLERAFPEPRLRQIAPGDRPGNLPLPGPGWHMLPGTPPMLVPGPSSITRLESDHSYTLTIDAKGHKTFTVKNGDGKSIFDGPVDTEEQQDKLPADLRENLHRLQQEMKQVQSPMPHAKESKKEGE